MESTNEERLNRSPNDFEERIRFGRLKVYLYPDQNSEPPSNYVLAFRQLIIFFPLCIITLLVISFSLHDNLVKAPIDRFVGQSFIDWENRHLIIGLSLNDRIEKSWLKKSDSKCSFSGEIKVNCDLDGLSTKDECEKKDCCFINSTEEFGFMDMGGNESTFRCFYSTDFARYRVLDVILGDNNATIKMYGKYRSQNHEAKITNIDVQIIGLDDDRLRIRVLDGDQDRYQVPMPFLNESKSELIESPLYSIKVNEHGMLTIGRKSTGTDIFIADLMRMIYTEQLIELKVKVPSNVLYGLGEHKDTFRKEIKGWRRYTFFSRDNIPKENFSLSGTFPFYLMTENDQKMNTHGVFLLNSNAIDILTQPTPELTWRTIGGILDFFIFLGPTASDVVRQYINLIGRPVLQPYWSFGFHISRNGYESLGKTKRTLERNLNLGIPIECQWNDLDYMNSYKEFTVDSIHYQDLKKFVDELHSKNMYYSIVINPGVQVPSLPGTYPPYEDGIESDVFIRAPNDEIFIGRSLNLNSYAYVDVTDPKTINYTRKYLQTLRDKIPFDGLQLNEIVNYGRGNEKICLDSDHREYNHEVGDMFMRTICMTAKLNLGSYYNVHNLYGLYENFVTYSTTCDTLKVRPFILSRSSYPSQGHFGSHWSGNIQSSWDHMKYSISNLLEFNIYGIPMIGSDICGHNGATIAELCMRWSALGAFYPFSRNNNARNTPEQDPAIKGEKVVAAAKYALDARYKLLPYLYGLFFKAHSNAETVVRPLFFEFPLDSNTYSIETAFLWGSWLYIVPILEPSTNQVTAYFPAGSWYNFADSKLAFNSSGQSETLTIDDDKIGLFVRGGGIIPTYKSSAKTTHDLRKQKYYLNAYLDNSGNAVGEIYHDDGKSLDSVTSGNYIHLNCSANRSQLVCSCQNFSEFDDFGIEGVTIFGLTNQPKNITLDGRSILAHKFNLENFSLEIELPDGSNNRQSFRIDFYY